MRTIPVPVPVPMPSPPSDMADLVHVHLEQHEHWRLHAFAMAAGYDVPTLLRGLALCLIYREVSQP